MNAEAIVDNKDIQTNKGPSLHRFWRWLTQPHPSITDIEKRRQSRLLSGIIVALNSTSAVASILLIMQEGGVIPQTVQFLWGGLAFTVILYFLNRSGRYRLAADIFVLFNFLIVHGLPMISDSAVWLMFVSMVMVMSAILLTTRATVALFIVSLVLQVVIGIFFPFQIEFSSVGPFIISGVTVPLLLVFMTHRQRLEGERQRELREANQKLRESEMALERRVSERTQELQLTNEKLAVALDQAEEANRLKSQFLASMSHELRTPLNAILNFNEMMMLGMVGEVSDQQKDLLSKSFDSAKHLLDLINDVLDISKMQSDLLTLFVEDDVDLSAEIGKVMDAASSLVRDREVKLVADFDKYLPIISGDKRRIRQIMLNLIANAVKFTEEGTVTVSAKHKGDDVLFAVIDTGPGISEEEQAIIFEPFIQTETGIKHQGGTGLGLPISRRLTELHGGRLWVESKPGEGASFFVSLPVEMPESARKAEASHV